MKKDMESFKKFINEHPKLIDEVKKKKRSWKEVYDDWMVLGDNHESWNRYAPPSEKEKKPQQQTRQKKDMTLNEFISMIGNINVSEIQNYISQFGGAVQGIQQIIQHFQSNQAAEQRPDTPENRYYPPTYKD